MGLNTPLMLLLMSKVKLLYDKCMKIVLDIQS